MIETVCKSCSAVDAGVEYRTRCDACGQLIEQPEQELQVNVTVARTAWEQRQFHSHAGCLPPGFDVEKRTIGGR